MPLNEILDLHKAFRRIEQDKRDDAWPDVVGYRDVKRNLGEILETIKLNLQNPNRYQANRPSLIDIPKRGFGLRPGLVPQIEDRIIYQAVADFLAPKFKSEDIVYSNRLAGNDKNQMFIQGVELWIEFQTKKEEYCHTYPFVVETDVTAYFDHINHDLLLSRINDLFGKVVGIDEINDIRTILGRQLGKWNFYGFNKFGIPQINDASSFFANLYLDELDKWLISKRMVALRYVDDICIFASDEPNARKALADLIIKLREMGLYIASGKTKIRKSEEVISELELGRGKIKIIETEIDSLEPNRLENAGELLKAYFFTLIEDPTKFNDRHFRFCVNRFKKLYVYGIAQDAQKVVIREILNRLSSMPETTEIFIDYLSLFPDNQALQSRILDFLESKYNIYPWQEMQLIELLIRSNIAPDIRTRSNQFANMIMVNGSHPAGRAKAYILLGKNGSYAEKRDIRGRYTQEDRDDIHRAIITAIQEMQTNERNNFYRSIDSKSQNTSWTIDYIQSLPQPKYHYFNPPSPNDDIPPDYDSDDFNDLGSEYFS